jgi:mannose/cellobiose epimerase-like protein (N-acyl-D-glucosamine 2-epimerase family)
MQLVSLGFFPNKKAKVSSTCAVAFVDTRTGFIYGVAERTSNEDQRSDVWNKEEAIEKARARAERAAFTQVLGDVEKLWGQIAARAMANRGAGGGAPPVSP